jgi:hypothetical protein
MAKVGDKEKVVKMIHAYYLIKKKKWYGEAPEKDE